MTVSDDHTGRALGAGTKRTVENYVSKRVYQGKRPVPANLVARIKRRFSSLMLALKR